MHDLDSLLEKIKQEGFLNHETMQSCCQLSLYEMETLYGTAYAAYDQERYEEAEKHFHLLVWLNAFSLKYWLGFAACLQMLEKYEAALHAYAVCTLLDEQNPYPHYHAFNCYMCLDNKEEAKKAIECAKERIHPGKHAALLEAITAEEELLC